MSDAERISELDLKPFHPRVGRTAQARLQWVLEVCRKNLDQLTPGDWWNLQREFAAFRAVTIPPDTMAPLWIQQAMAGEPWTEAALNTTTRASRGRGRLARARQGVTLMASFHVGVSDLPTPAQVRTAQKRWQKIIKPLLKPDGMKSLKPMAMSLMVEREDRMGRSWLFINPKQKPRDPSGALQLMLLLGAFAHRLGQCPETGCGRWFVAARKGQAYCSRTCQNRAAIRAYRSKRARGKT